MPNAENSSTLTAPNTDSRPLEVFFKLADLWHLTSDQQIKLLGSPGRSTFFKWKRDGGQLSADTEERISHLVSIFKALEITVPNANAADDWVHRPNRFFGGRSALEVMLDGKVTDIFRVRSYLDAERGG